MFEWIRYWNRSFTFMTYEDKLPVINNNILSGNDAQQ